METYEKEDADTHVCFPVLSVNPPVLVFLCDVFRLVFNQSDGILGLCSLPLLLFLLSVF